MAAADTAVVALKLYIESAGAVCATPTSLALAGFVWVANAALDVAPIATNGLGAGLPGPGAFARAHLGADAFTVTAAIRCAYVLGATGPREAGIAVASTVGANAMACAVLRADEQVASGPSVPLDTVAARGGARATPGAAMGTDAGVHGDAAFPAEPATADAGAITTCAVGRAFPPERIRRTLGNIAMLARPVLLAEAHAL